jgi:hypothetical protein
MAITKSISLTLTPGLYRPNSDTIYKNHDGSLPKSFSDGILNNKYYIKHLRLTKNIYTQQQFVSNIDGLVAKIVNNTSSAEYDPYDINIITGVLLGVRNDYMIEWVHFDI